MSLSKIFSASDNFITARILPDMKERTDWQIATPLSSQNPQKKDGDDAPEFRQDVFGESNDPPAQDVAPIPEEEIQSVEEIRKEAFEQGIQAGLVQAEILLNEPLQALANAMEDISQLRENLLRENSTEMLKLIMAIAEQVIHSEISIKEEAVLTILEEALHAAIESDEYQVKINPEDFKVVSEKKPELMASIKGLKNMTFEADPKIIRGGCLIESELGQVDATIGGRLEEIRQHLASSLEKG